MQEHEEYLPEHNKRQSFTVYDNQSYSILDGSPFKKTKSNPQQRTLISVMVIS